MSLCVALNFEQVNRLEFRELILSKPHGSEIIESHDILKHGWLLPPFEQAMVLLESVFVKAAIASGLVTTNRLEYAFRLARHRAIDEGRNPKEPIDDTCLSKVCVELGYITPYQAMQLCAGRTKLNLGPYQITDFIGQGGMGQVFKGIHQVMGRECAVKVLPRTRLSDETRESFAREIRMQARLDSPYLVRAYDAGQDGAVHYLVTEYVPGMDLRRLVRARGPLPIDQAASIIMQAALGLDYAHQKGLIHRDVKPGNILVTPEGQAKVSDVGLAGFAADLADDPRAGKIVGTADYLSPEQIKTPLQIGPTSDIYSLGCTLYYAISGKVPFPGGDTQSKVRRQLNETPWHPRRFVPSISEEFVDIIADMMEKDPKQRIQTAAEVASRLEVWAGDAGQLTGYRSLHSPWMVPPPPAIEPDVVEAYLSQEPGGQDTGPSQSGADPGTPAVASLGDARMFESEEPSDASPRPSSKVMSTNADHSRENWFQIAVAIAIVLPPALLLGAILGILVYRSYVM